MFVRSAMVLTLALGSAATAVAQISGVTLPNVAANSPLRAARPASAEPGAPLTLTLGDVVHRALEQNLGLLTANEAGTQAEARSRIARADLFPNVNGRVGETRQVTNLEAFGFPLGPGFPSIVGPFNVFDARLTMSQALLDLRALGEARAAAHDVTATRLTYKSRRDLVALLAAGAYLQTLAAGARSDAALAQRNTSEALYNQAVNLRQGGLIAGIDVIRAEVRFASERQRQTLAQSDFEKAKLQLARLIGLPPGQMFTLATEFPDVAVPDITIQQALDRAYMERPDYRSALERLRAAEESKRAAAGELLPSARLNADYGTIGLTARSAHPTFSVAGVLTVPLFQGGRTQARLTSAEADVRTRQAELDSMRADIYYDIRNAFLDLDVTRENLNVATRARDLADQQLTQARDRFAAGVASNVEVIQAQEAVATATEQFIAGRYGYLLAKAMLAGSLGIAEQEIERYLGGTRP